MKDRTILRTGVTGLAIAAVCCFTPILVLLLGVAGLSSWLGWLDYILLPALALFLALTAYGFFLRRRNKVLACGATTESPETDRAR